MKFFYEFPKIEQLKNCFHQLNYQTRFIGKDEDGNPLFDGNIPLPTLEFEGTIKLHGTNGGIIKYMEDENIKFQIQSREKILNFPHNDNAAFAQFCLSTVGEENLKNLFSDISSFDNVSVFGEWCGGNIQGGVGISGLPKMFVIFAIKVMESEEKSYWINIDPEIIKKYNNLNIYHINQFETYKIEIDFNDLESSVDIMYNITNKVEEQCPVAKCFNKQGIGEGVVWKCLTPGFWSSRFWFKVKGEKHKSSKERSEKIAVDFESLESFQEFANLTVTESRLSQGLEHIPELHKKNTGIFVNWILNDIMEEEKDTMIKNGSSKKDVGGKIAEKARNWFIKKCDSM